MTPQADATHLAIQLPRIQERGLEQTKKEREGEIRERERGDKKRRESWEGERELTKRDRIQ